MAPEVIPEIVSSYKHPTKIKRVLDIENSKNPRST
jgi:hypothetical protein